MSGIVDILDSGRIVETDTAPYTVNPLSVSKSKNNKGEYPLRIIIRGSDRIGSISFVHVNASKLI